MGWLLFLETNVLGCDIMGWTEEIMKHIEVVAGVIEFGGKILCMQREKGKHDYVSYKWEFPGGKIEIGET